MKVEIIMDSGANEVECDDVQLHDGMIHVIRDGRVIEMWNTSKIVGVIIE